MTIGRRSTLALLGAGLIVPATGLAGTTRADALWAKIKKRGTLRIGMEGTYPPFDYETSAGKLTGYDADFARALCKTLGVKPDFVLIPWDGLLASLETGRIDAVVNQVTITKARQQKYAFSLPYTISGMQIIVRKGTTGITGPATLAGKRVGVNLGTNYESWLKQNVPTAKIVTYQDDPTMLQDLRVGRIAAVINDRLMLSYAIKHANWPFIPAGKPFAKQEMGVAMEKDNTVLLGKIDHAIRHLEADGTLKRISDRWFGTNVS